MIEIVLTDSGSVWMKVKKKKKVIQAYRHSVFLIHSICHTIECNVTV